MHFYIDIKSFINGKHWPFDNAVLVRSSSKGFPLGQVMTWTGFSHPLALMYPFQFLPLIPSNLEIPSCVNPGPPCCAHVLTPLIGLQMLTPLLCLPLSRLPVREIAILAFLLSQDLLCWPPRRSGFLSGSEILSLPWSAVIYLTVMWLAVYFPNLSLSTVSTWKVDWHHLQLLSHISITPPDYSQKGCYHVCLCFLESRTRL